VTLALGGLGIETWLLRSGDDPVRVSSCGVAALAGRSARRLTRYVARIDNGGTRPVRYVQVSFAPQDAAGDVIAPATLVTFPGPFASRASALVSALVLALPVSRSGATSATERYACRAQRVGYRDNGG